MFPSVSLFLHPFSHFSLTPKLTTNVISPFFSVTTNETTISHPFVSDIGYLCPTNSFVVVVFVNFFTSVAPSFVLLTPHCHVVTQLRHKKATITLPSQRFPHRLWRQTLRSTPPSILRHQKAQICTTTLPQTPNNHISATTPNTDAPTIIITPIKEERAERGRRWGKRRQRVIREERELFECVREGRGREVCFTFAEEGGREWKNWKKKGLWNYQNTLSRRVCTRVVRKKGVHESFLMFYWSSTMYANVSVEGNKVYLMSN